MCVNLSCRCAGMDVKTLRQLFLQLPVVKLCGEIEKRSFSQTGMGTHTSRKHSSSNADSGLEDILTQYGGKVQDYKDRDAWSLTEFLESVTLLVIKFEQKRLLRGSEEILDIIIECLPLAEIGEPLRGIKGKTDQDILEIMKSDQVMLRLAGSLKRLCDNLEARKSQQAFTGEDNDKFSKAFFGDIETFFAGLEGKIDIPNPKVLETMKVEHCSSKDSEVEFKTSNYKIETNPK